MIGCGLPQAQFGRLRHRSTAVFPACSVRVCLRPRAQVRWAGQSLVEVLVISLVLVAVFWGYGRSQEGVLTLLWRAMQQALTQFGELLALPV